MRKVLNIVSVLFILLIIIVWTLPHLGFTYYEVLSDSMAPMYKTGDVVIVNTNDRNIVPGDIIVFRMGNTVVVHRVETILDDGIVTHGDANQTVDPGIRDMDDVVGKVLCGFSIFSNGFRFISGLGKIAVIFVLITLHVFAEMDNNDDRGRRKEGCRNVQI